MTTPYLATYGTLMRPFGTIEHLGLQRHLAYRRPCKWRGVLYDLGPYPGAVRGEGTVHGELYRVESSEVWATLDDYEGYDPEREEASRFIRRRVELRAPTDLTAWVYWFNGSVEEVPHVPSGDWAAYTAEG